MIQDMAAEIYEFPGASDKQRADIDLGIETMESELFQYLHAALRGDARIAVRLVRHSFPDYARDAIVHHRRLEFDEIDERVKSRRPLTMMVSDDANDIMYERRGHSTQRLTSRLVGNVPAPLLPRVEPPVPPVPPVPALPPKVESAEPWYKQAATFFKDAWDEAGKIQGCKL